MLMNKFYLLLVTTFIAINSTAQERHMSMANATNVPLDIQKGDASSLKQQPEAVLDPHQRINARLFVGSQPEGISYDRG